MQSTRKLHYYLAFRKVAYSKKDLPDLLLIEMSLLDFPILPNTFSIDDIWWILGEFRMYYPGECRLCKVNNTTGNIDFENKSYCLDTVSGYYRLGNYNNLKFLLNNMRYIIIKPVRKW